MKEERNGREEREGSGERREERGEMAKTNGSLEAMVSAFFFAYVALALTLFCGVHTSPLLYH